jgi:hypothetical protein
MHCLCAEDRNKGIGPKKFFLKSNLQYVMIPSLSGVCAKAIHYFDKNYV